MDNPIAAQVAAAASAATRASMSIEMQTGTPTRAEDVRLIGVPDSRGNLRRFGRFGKTKFGSEFRFGR